MIKAVTVINHRGEFLTIDLFRPEDSGLIVRSISGLGPVAATINATEMASYDGSRFNSARRGARNIVFDLVFLETKNQAAKLYNSIESVRLLAYRMFPVKREVELIFETENRTVSTRGYVESNEPNIFSNQVSSQISILCLDPHFYSAGLDGDTPISFSNTTPLFEFQFENLSTTQPLLNFGSTVLESAKTIDYQGEVETGVYVNAVASGAVQGFTLYNYSAREVMKFDHARLVAITGSGFSAGDTLSVSTRRGEKHAVLNRNGVAYNVLSSLGRDTAWLTLVTGDNLIGYSADVGSGLVRLSVSYKTVFEGV